MLFICLPFEFWPFSLSAGVLLLMTTTTTMPATTIAVVFVARKQTLIVSASDLVSVLVSLSVFDVDFVFVVVAPVVVVMAMKAFVVESVLKAFCLGGITVLLRHVLSMTLRIVLLLLWL